MHNALFVAALISVIAIMTGIGCLFERARRRRIRPGFCHTCNETPVEPGETECFDCWVDRQW